MSKIGIYVLGARGNVATLAAAGAHAISQGWADSTGMVTACSDFAELDLLPLADMVFGGVDPAPLKLDAKLAELAESGRMLPNKLAADLAPVMQAVDQRVDSALPFTAEGLPEGGYAHALEKITADLSHFKQSNQLDRLVLVNLISTEAEVQITDLHATAERFEHALESNTPRMANVSMLYAWVALGMGVPVVNFTPSQSLEVPAIAERAQACGVPHAGKDGKTGETLLKTVLGPMFVARGMRVKSWLANNYLGNNDGKSLSEPERRATKITSKDQALRSILGSEPYLSTDIGYAPSLDDWKTAWDLIHFEGFLGTMMSMQFTWQGCDSALAAPLVLDLIRLIEFAQRRGEAGPQHYLASFFKSPQDVTQHGFSEQLAMLQAQVAAWMSPQESALASHA